MKDGRLEPSLITLSSPKSPVAEAFRTLRTNLQFSSPDRPLRTLAVTSAGPDEGKSTIVANLAVATAQAGSRVIVVGCDLRKPVQHRLFGLGNRVGLTQVLLGRVSLDEALQPTGIENLTLLASGPIPPNPSELLGSRAMQHVIEALQERAEMVIFDLPPVIAVTDAAVLAPKVDGVLLVLSAGQVPREVVQDARQLLENVKARLVGVVLNRIPVQEGHGYYYYYYYYGEDGRDQAAREEAATAAEGSEAARQRSRRPVQPARRRGLLAHLFSFGRR